MVSMISWIHHDSEKDIIANIEPYGSYVCVPHVKVSPSTSS